jgi:hypothetical protein
MRPATIVQGINQAQEGATRFFFVCTAAMEISGGSSNTSFLGCLRRVAAAIENYEQIFSSC